MSLLTWAKFGSEFFPKLRKRKPSVDAALTHTEAIAYLYTIEQYDCVFEKDLLPAIAMSPKRYDAADELVRLGLWRDHGDSWEVIDHGDVLRQSLAAQAKKLDRDKRAQAAARTRKSRASDDVSADASDEVSGDADSQTDRQEKEAPVVPLPRASGEPWPTVLPPGGSSRENWRIAAKGYDRD